MANRAARLGLTALTTAVAAFVLALVIASAAPVAFGDRSYTVLSGSMAPTIDTGDVVVVAPVAARSARVGDILAFKRPGHPLTSHRARSITARGGQIHFVTQGDANTGQEHWTMPAGQSVGKVRYRVPKLGFAIAKMQTPVGVGGLIILPALLLAGSLLAGIWRDEGSTRARA